MSPTSSIQNWHITAAALIIEAQQLNQTIVIEIFPNLPRNTITLGD